MTRALEKCNKMGVKFFPCEEQNIGAVLGFDISVRVILASEDGGFIANESMVKERILKQFLWLHSSDYVTSVVKWYGLLGLAGEIRAGMYCKLGGFVIEWALHREVHW